VLTRRTFVSDVRGVAAVEFALLLPILMLLYFGVVELTQGAMTQQRAAHAASTIGDLTAQSSSLTKAQVGDIFTVGTTTMYPYPTATLKMRITSLAANSAGTVKVVWSQGQGLTAYAPGTTMTPPTNVIAANESAVMSESSYTYTSIFGELMPTPVTFKSTYYLHPRLSTQVTCADC
jgi:Flp pilus assembly protein TadG